MTDARDRASGILLHPTSLPGPHGCGDFGAGAYHFVDWLAAAGQSLWQVLPLGGVGAGDSPYMSDSAFAGHLLLIDLQELQQRGWLDAEDLQTGLDFDARRVDYARVRPWRMARLRKAAASFERMADDDARADFNAFCTAESPWLDDHALFMALADAHTGAAWCDWAPPLTRREPAALAAARQQHAGDIAFWKFGQWCFARQWQRLKAYANQRGVQLVGDVPIFVSLHSADVWAHQDLFELDAQGRPSVVAGVPPDYFSATGQRWGNPLYRWSAHRNQGYAWWIARMRHICSQVDRVRIDHFRGFAAYWEIPASEPTAIVGRWVEGPGAEWFEAVRGALGGLPVIAEDLGIITEEVTALRQRFALPGMRVLQFAFGGGADNLYLPHKHTPDSVVYTGTHDNNTTLGWWQEAGEAERTHVRQYLGIDGHDIAWDLIRVALASVADTAIVPMQDVLALGADCRMNLPGQGEGWWVWRVGWSQVRDGHAERLRGLTRLYGR